MSKLRIEEIIDRALELERTAIKEYNQLKEGADAETAELLEFLIAQEKEHIKMLSERKKAIKLLKK